VGSGQAADRPFEDAVRVHTRTRTSASAPVRCPVKLGNGPVVAHIVDGGGRHKAGRHQVLHARLTVEGVAAGEAHDARVSGHPRIRGVGVFGVHLRCRDMEVLRRIFRLGVRVFGGRERCAPGWIVCR